MSAATLLSCSGDIDAQMDRINKFIRAFAKHDRELGEDLTNPSIKHTEKEINEALALTDDVTNAARLVYG